MAAQVNEAKIQQRSAVVY